MEATVSPSEDIEKVVEAVRNVAGGAPGDIEEIGEKVRVWYADIKSLGHLRDQLRDRHVRSAARRLLVRAKHGNKTVLMLNRQAASAGVLAVCGAPEESPLGPIYITIDSTELDKVIDWLAAYGEG
jgi:predicted RNA binding protein with dsRBD fold (UPF0201 family)